MNQYPRYPGDYLKKTLGLSMLEDGAYTRLLDAYYAEECGIEHERRYAIARAVSDDEKKAVDYILSRYFKLVGSTYEHYKANEVIEAVHNRVAASRKNGAKGGRPSAKTKPNKNPSGNPNTNPNESLQNQSQREINTTPPPPDDAEVAGGGSLASPAPAPQPEDSPPPAPTLVDSLPPTPSPPAKPTQPSPQVLVCMALQAAGIAEVNSGHPKLLALVGAGATVDEFVGFVPAAQKAGAGFAWILAAVANERTRAAETVKGLHQGSMQDAKPWYETRKGIEAMGERLGLGRWDSQAFDLGRGEMFSTYERRVRAAAQERGVAA